MLHRISYTSPWCSAKSGIHLLYSQCNSSSRRLFGALSGVAVLCLFCLYGCHLFFRNPFSLPTKVLRGSSDFPPLPRCPNDASLQESQVINTILKAIPSIHREVVHFDFSLGWTGSQSAVFDLVFPEVAKSGLQDIIASGLSRGLIWENKETSFIGTKMFECADLFGGDKSRCSFLDVGSNFGWFAITVASLGFPVVAVEGNAMLVPGIYSSIKMPTNAVVEGSTVKDVRLVPFAWGQVAKKCELQSSVDNFYGGGTVQCGDAETMPGKVKRGEVYVFPGDCFLEDSQSVYVLKIDVEGFEVLALRGMKLFFERSPPRYVMSEVHEGLLKSKGFSGVKLMEELVGLGYVCQVVGGAGVAVGPEHFEGAQGIANIRCELDRQGWWGRRSLIL